MITVVVVVVVVKKPDWVELVLVNEEPDEPEDPKDPEVVVVDPEELPPADDDPPEVPLALAFVLVLEVVVLPPLADPLPELWKAPLLEVEEAAPELKLLARSTKFR